MNASYHATDASAAPLLQRLEGVQKSGTGWRARCPACGGASRKVSVCQADGRVLVHCFGCNDASAVLAAVGLNWANLQPPRHWPQTSEERRRARHVVCEAAWSSALSTLALEATVVLIAARQLANWQLLSKADDTRLSVAVERIDGATSVLTEPRFWRPAA
ncbi:DNA primase [Cognatilysobacter tabacisoli]|uniref:DNA primase n=1 Tax=Cognatilysobacter tabacisoli TaxID=2315424 RepID=UPI001300BC82|nr:DNA primase [Lysobacter tabacisoli]